MIGNYPVDFYELACKGKDLKDGKCLGIQKPESSEIIDACYECEHFILRGGRIWEKHFIRTT